jgi:hypothetical protein
MTDDGAEGPALAPGPPIELHQQMAFADARLAPDHSPLAYAGPSHVLDARHKLLELAVVNGLHVDRGIGGFARHAWSEGIRFQHASEELVHPSSPKVMITVLP